MLVKCITVEHAALVH